LNVFSKTQPKPYVNSISCGWPQLSWLCPDKRHPKTSCRRTDVFYGSWVELDVIASTIICYPPLLKDAMRLSGFFNSPFFKRII